MGRPHDVHLYNLADNDLYHSGSALLCQEVFTKHCQQKLVQPVGADTGQLMKSSQGLLLFQFRDSSPSDSFTDPGAIAVMPFQYPWLRRKA